MSLRPRYSLLTLLILTAFVAGGVKLWYGPHHVVEEPSPNIEVEYTYYRYWRDIQTFDGPGIYRVNARNGTPEQYEVHYYRRGEHLAKRIIFMNKEKKTFCVIPYGDLSILLPSERQAFDEATSKEEKRVRAFGFELE